MGKIYLCLIAILSLLVSPIEAKKIEDGVPHYEIAGAGTAIQGSYLVDISVLSKNKTVSDQQLISAAVHGVLFRGFSNPNGRGFQKPLAGSASNEAQHADFYKDFFSATGLSKNYGNVINGSRSITKVGKEFRVSAKVTVEKEVLIKYLQEAGVVKSLNSAF